jgi:KTSC domain
MARYWKIALALFLLNAPARAAAPFQPCPTFQAGWTMTYAPPITAVQYDELSGLLYVIFNYATASAYSGVPISVIQAFSPGANPTQVYNNLVVPSYHALLLQQQTNCPLLNDNGNYLWSR